MADTEIRLKTSATVGGKVELALVFPDGERHATVTLAPDAADTIASDLTKAAKMARAAVEPTAPPVPEERP